MSRKAFLSFMLGLLTVSGAFFTYFYFEREKNLHLRSLNNPSKECIQCNLQGRKLVNRDLRGYNLSGSNLRGADLRCADLSYAHLFGADLTGANLSGAQLTGAEMLYTKMDRVIWQDGSQCPIN